MSASSKTRSGGVLPVNATTRKTTATQSAPKSSQKASAPRLRLIIRRLPPGLTEAEFWATLGDDWKVGNGNVEWAAFKDGKISKDPAKPSRPARAYVKVKEQSVLDLLSAAVKSSTFQDAKNSSKDLCLLGPPSLEFAPYNKMPGGRSRNDGRQGTIDQDPELIAFLQSLTEPITKGAAGGADAGEPKDEKVSTTPLVQYIKEKKATKAKEKEQAKAAKRDGKEGKTPKNEPKPTIVIKGKNASSAEKERVAKATQEAVKAINKSVASLQSKSTPAKAEAKQPAKETTPQLSEPAKKERPRERDNARAVARMLQRDLGLVAKENQGQRGSKAAAQESPTTSSTKPGPIKVPKDTQPAAADQKPSTPATPTSTPPTGPRGSRTPSAASTKPPTSTPSQRPNKSTPQPTAGAKSAFLKHANPSQGITEELLRNVFTEFGTLTRCEIDKKKGLGYVDFGDSESLKKAMTASPVKVGNGQVQVLENKQSHGKKGGSAVKGPTTAAQGSAGSTPTASTATINSPKTATTATPIPPTASASTDAPPTSTTDAVPSPSSGGNNTPKAPRGNARGGSGGGGGGGGSGGRAGRGGNSSSGGGRGGRANNSRNQNQNQNQSQSPAQGQGQSPASAASPSTGQAQAQGQGQGQGRSGRGGGRRGGDGARKNPAASTAGGASEDGAAAAKPKAEAKKD